MSIQLTVNNFPLELEDQRIPVNFQGTDASNTAELLVSFTNSFNIPDTDYNNGILENAHQVFSDSKIPYVSIECSLTVKGMDLFGKSRLVLLEHNKAGWRASFYAGAHGVAMGGGIRTIPLSNIDYDHGDFVGAVLSTTGVNTSPIDWNFSKRVIDDEIDLQYHRPSVYVADLIRTMLQAGFITLNIHPSVKVAQRIVIPLQDLKKIKSQYEGYSTKAVRDLTNQTLTGGMFSNILIWQGIIEGNSPAGAGGYDGSTGVLSIPYTSKVNVKASIKLDIVNGAGSPRFFNIHAALGGPDIQVIFTPDALGEHLVNVSADEIIVSDTNFPAGSPYCTFAIGFQSPETGDRMLIGSTLQIEVMDDAVPVSGTLTGGTNTIDIAASLPDMSRSDLMKEWLMMFNGIAYFKSGILNVTSFDSLPEQDGRDWSKKVDTESERTTIVTSPLGKITQFKYDNNDDVPTTYGGAKVAIDNQNIEDVKIYHTSKFGASRDTFFLGLECMQIPIFNGTVNSGSGTASHTGGTGNLNITFSEGQEFRTMGDYVRIPHLQRDFLITNWIPSTLVATVAGPTTIPNFTNRDFEIWSVKQTKMNPRLGVVSEGNFSASIKYRLYNNVSTLTSFKQIQFNGPDSLFWTNLLLKFYRLWLGSLESYKMIRLFVLLNEADIMDFDSTNCIFIEGMGKFYCQALNKYTGDGEPTEAELVAIKNPIATTKITTL